MQTFCFSKLLLEWAILTAIAQAISLTLVIVVLVCLSFTVCWLTDYSHWYCCCCIHCLHFINSFDLVGNIWISAKDSLQFIIRWMNRFPRYKNREVYLTGESYAGHYVPQLARAIVHYNANAKQKINLKGFMVIIYALFIYVGMCPSLNTIWIVNAGGECSYR